MTFYEFNNLQLSNWGDSLKPIRSNRINRVQILTGILCLFLGGMVYLVARPPDQIYFLSRGGMPISLYHCLPNILGPAGQSLPSLIHVFSFILITAGIMGCEKRGGMICCVSWLILDSAFELGQRFHAWPQRIIPDWFSGVPLLENTRNYFACGTFDSFDLAAIVIGTLIAFWVLSITTERRQPVL